MNNMNDINTLEAAKAEVIKWNEELTAARHAYYVLAEPVMEDKAYDLLELQLTRAVEMFPEFRVLAPVLDCVGSDLKDGAGRIRHTSPTLSIENCYSVPELEEWYDSLKLPEGSVVTIEPKVDGVSCTLKYVGCKLVQAVTRGDGLYGEDITPAIAATASIPNELPSAHYPDSLVEIRGEVFITQKTLDSLNAEIQAAGGKPYANVRNLAAGTIKLKDTDEVKKRKLQFRPWQVFGIPATGATALEYIHKNTQQGYASFVSPDITRIRSKGEIPKAIDLVSKLRESLWHTGMSMLTDGVVLKVDDPAHRERLGIGTKTVHWARAFKFQSMTGITYLHSVEWQVGRTGKLTPVGEVSPINLGGAIVTRVTLNNWSWMQGMGITCLPCDIELCRSGDVIPKITRVVVTGAAQRITPIQEPTTCPSCGSELSVYEDASTKILTHWCENPECGGQLADHIFYIGGRTILDIDGLGYELAKKFVEDEIVRDLGDLFMWHQSAAPHVRESWFDASVKEAGMPSAQIRTLIGGLESAKVRPWDRWLTALGIPGIGKTLGGVVAQTLRLKPEDLPALPQRLLALKDDTIEGIGPKKLTRIHTWAKERSILDMLAKLYVAGVRPASLLVEAPSEGPLSGYAIVISGEFEEDRDSISKKLTSLGASMKSGITRKVNLLLLGDAPGKSKLAKAQELNIRTVDRNWLVKTLTDNGLTLESSIPWSAEIADI